MADTFSPTMPQSIPQPPAPVAPASGAGAPDLSALAQRAASYHIEQAQSGAGPEARGLVNKAVAKAEEPPPAIPQQKAPSFGGVEQVQAERGAAVDEASQLDEATRFGAAGIAERMATQRQEEHTRYQKLITDGEDTELYFNHPSGLEGVRKDEATIASNDGSSTMAPEVAAAKLRMQKAQEPDPSRWWNDLGTGRQILAGIALFLGGMGGGANPVLGMFERAIQNDLASQLKRKEGLGKKNSWLQKQFDLRMSQFKDEETALNQTRADALGMIQNQLNQKIALFGQDANIEMKKVEINQAIDTKRLQLETDGEQKHLSRYMSTMLGGANALNAQERTSLGAAETERAANAPQKLVASERKELRELNYGIAAFERIQEKFDTLAGGAKAIISGSIPTADAAKFKSMVLDFAQDYAKTNDPRISDKDMERQLVILGDQKSTKEQTYAVYQYITEKLQLRKKIFAGVMRPLGFNLSEEALNASMGDTEQAPDFRNE